MGWADWKALPWYEQRALREGMLLEFDGVQMVPQSGADDELAAAGITFN